MKREDLVALGLSDDAVIDRIMEINGKDIEHHKTTAEALQKCLRFRKIVAVFYCFSRIFDISREKRKPAEKLDLQGFLRVFRGAANQIRTGDLVLTKDVLYHLSHSSTLFFQRKRYYTKPVVACQSFFSENPTFRYFSANHSMM